MKNIAIANLIHDIHILLVIYILFGFYFTPIQYLKYYLYLIIIIFLDWNDFDGQCILTRLEHYFRTGIWKQKDAIYEGAPEFFRPFISKLLNINMTRRNADKLNNFVFMLCFLFGFIRFTNYHKI
jgi:hypothetical protein